MAFGEGGAGGGETAVVADQFEQVGGIGAAAIGGGESRVALGRVAAQGEQVLDSAALAVLLEVERLAVAWGRAFEVRGVPPKLAALAKLYGVDVLLLKPEAAVAAAGV